jgi:hypothetical protein
MEPIEAAKGELLAAVQRMTSLVEATPDDRLFWKPSPNSRSIGEIVAHTAHALGNIERQMRGEVFEIPTSAEANRAFLEHDGQFSGRAEVQDYLRGKADSYTAFLESLAQGDLERLAPLPFGLGEGPLRFYIEAGASHTKGHVAQIEYIQTLYGDHDWHWGF